MTAALLDGSAQAIAEAVRTGAASAQEITQDALNRVESLNPAVGAFTDVTAARALAKAKEIDAARAQGAILGPLAGAPFAVKNLFDVAGLTTRAGSKINRDRPPATADATAVARLEAAGGVLIGALNMGEYAYDFTGQNSHDGPSRNPHDLKRMTGGSSGGRLRPWPGVCSDRVGIGHKWVHSRPEFALRIVRPQADLWSAFTRRHVPVCRESGSCGADRAIRG